jgi:hypothetical protein
VQINEKIITTFLTLAIGSLCVMAETGYRAFPPEIENPSKAETIGKLKFKLLKTIKMQDAPSTYEGHEGTIIWYVDKIGYIVEIKFTDHPTVYAKSICTFTPTMGMDKIDGSFAEDIEAYYLNKHLGFQTDRLLIFEGKDSVGIETYLKNRGFIK